MKERCSSNSTQSSAFIVLVVVLAFTLVSLVTIANGPTGLGAFKVSTTSITILGQEQPCPFAPSDTQTPCPPVVGKSGGGSASSSKSAVSETATTEAIASSGPSAEHAQQVNPQETRKQETTEPVRGPIFEVVPKFPAEFPQRRFFVVSSTYAWAIILILGLLAIFGLIMLLLQRLNQGKRKRRK